jgi:hypothetical protein
VSSTGAVFIGSCLTADFRFDGFDVAFCPGKIVGRTFRFQSRQQPFDLRLLVGIKFFGCRFFSKRKGSLQASILRRRRCCENNTGRECQRQRSGCKSSVSKS